MAPSLWCAGAINELMHGLWTQRARPEFFYCNFEMRRGWKWSQVKVLQRYNSLQASHVLKKAATTRDRSMCVLWQRILHSSLVAQPQCARDPFDINRGAVGVMKSTNTNRCGRRVEQRALLNQSEWLPELLSAVAWNRRVQSELKMQRIARWPQNSKNEARETLKFYTCLKNGEILDVFTSKIQNKT